MKQLRLQKDRSGYTRRRKGRNGSSSSPWTNMTDRGWMKKSLGSVVILQRRLPLSPSASATGMWNCRHGRHLPYLVVKISEKAHRRRFATCWTNWFHDSRATAIVLAATPLQVYLRYGAGIRRMCFLPSSGLHRRSGFRNG